MSWSTSFKVKKVVLPLERPFSCTQPWPDLRRRRWCNHRRESHLPAGRSSWRCHVLRRLTSASCGGSWSYSPCSSQCVRLRELCFLVQVFSFPNIPSLGEIPRKVAGLHDIQRVGWLAGRSGNHIRPPHHTPGLSLTVKGGLAGNFVNHRVWDLSLRTFKVPPSYQ